MNNDIRYIELAKACGLYGSESFMNDVLEFAYSIAVDERKNCLKILLKLHEDYHHSHNHYLYAARKIDDEKADLRDNLQGDLRGE